MNNYTHNMQFHHWNELISQKERGNLDCFHFSFKSCDFGIFEKKKNFGFDSSKLFQNISKFIKYSEYFC